ncbi:MAG: hypothetical protein HYU98_06955 [Deltaproteobacteria bacterium]|nr:hypothetical protein [Deltaproteobacteria bacterium]
MKKYASLILLLFFLIISCKEKGGTSAAKEPPDNGPETQLTSCTGNENCKSGEICKDSVCTAETAPAKCSHDSECPSGQFCSNGTCTAKGIPAPAACASDTNCSSGLKCDNGTCVIPPLTCDASETLVDETCKTNGTAKTACKEGGLCNPGLACDANNTCLGTGTWTHLGKAIPFPALASGAVARLGSITYVGTYSGVFKTSDGGTTWAPINNGLPGISQVTALITVGQNIYAGLASEGVYVTTDGGLSWSPLNSGLTPGGKYLMSLLKAPKAGPFYAGTMDGVFSTSSSNPGEWQSIGLKDLKVRSLAHYNSKLYATTFEQGGVFVYGSGENWSNQNAGLEFPDTAFVKPVLSLAVSNQFGLIAAVSDGIYRLNYKTSKSEPVWTPIFSDISPAILTVAGDEIYAAQEEKKFYKYSGGKWVPIGIADVEDYLKIIPLDDKIFIITDKAVYKTAASNIDWKPVEYDVGYDFIVDILYVNNTLIATTDARGPAYSTDGGAGWTYSDSDDKYAYIGSQYIAIKQNNNIIYAVSSTGDVLRSDDGINWEPISEASYTPYSSPRDFIFFDNSIYIAAGGGVFKYENLSEWKDLKAPKNAYSLAVFNGEVYAGSDGGLYKYANGKWVFISMENVMVTALFPYENYLYAGSSSGIYQLSNIDDVASLVPEAVTLEGHKIIDLEAFGDDIYAATSLGLYKTSKGGNEWTKVNELSDVGAITSLFATKDMLFAGTAGLGVYAYAP